MRRFFGPANLAAFIAVALIATPFTNRIAAQDTQANVDSVVAAHETAVVADAPVATVDFRAVQKSAPAATRTSQASAGASMVGLRSAVHGQENTSLALTAAPSNANLGQSRAMMIVGGAALVTGAIIGGDAGTLIMVGGAVIGLYGLYQYLQ